MVEFKPVDLTIITVALCLTAIELLALMSGIDGQVMTAIVGILGGIGGYKAVEKVKSTT